MPETLTLLRDLVAIDSVNPSLVPGGAGEGEAAAYLEAYFRRHAIDVELHEVAPGRPNIIATVQGRTEGPTLLLCGHLDTVGVEGMDAPFTPVEQEGKLYGRGAQDMKAGVAACAAALVALATDGLERGRVIFAGVIDEEHASLGAEALVRDVTADAAIVAEPTDLQVAVAHKGFAWLEVEVRGKAAHGSRPDEGRDAILRMGRLLGVLERFDSELRARPTHPLLGSGSLHASHIEGGHEMSSYPALCRLRFERRTVPGEDGGRALAEVEQMIAVLREADRHFDANARVVMERPPYVVDERSEIVQAVTAACADAGLPAAAPAGMTYWTDAALLAAAGIPSVVIGPRGAGLHGTVEYVDLESTTACRQVLVAAARRLLAGTPPGSNA